MKCILLAVVSAAALSGMAGKLAADAVTDGGAVVARMDGLDQGQLSGAERAHLEGRRDE